MRGDLMRACLVWAARSSTDNFWVPSHQFNSATGEENERNHSDHLYWLRAAQSYAYLINAKRQAEKRKPPSFYLFGVTRSGIEPRPPAPRADALTTVLRGGGDSGIWNPATELFGYIPGYILRSVVDLLHFTRSCEFMFCVDLKI